MAVMVQMLPVLVRLVAVAVAVAEMLLVPLLELLPHPVEMVVQDAQPAI
jgi:hypothetical protein